jgi:type II secretory pathway component PulM
MRQIPYYMLGAAIGFVWIYATLWLPNRAEAKESEFARNLPENRQARALEELVKEVRQLRQSKACTCQCKCQK